MHQLGYLVSEHFLGLVEFGPFQRGQLVDLFHRKEREHPETFVNVRIRHIPPVLVELIGRRSVRIQPEGTLLRLTHLLSLAGCKQGEGHCIRLLVEHAAAQLHTAQHVGPLVVAAELHFDVEIP